MLDRRSLVGPFVIVALALTVVLASDTRVDAAPPRQDEEPVTLFNGNFGGFETAGRILPNGQSSTQEFVVPLGKLLIIKDINFFQGLSGSATALCFNLLSTSADHLHSVHMYKACAQGVDGNVQINEHFTSGIAIGAGRVVTIPFSGTTTRVHGVLISAP